MALNNNTEVVFPHQVAVDPDQENLAVFVHADEGLFIPQTTVTSFRLADEAYKSNKSQRFANMTDSVTLSGVRGVPFDRAFIHTPQDMESRALRLVYSPLNDGRPESSAQLITRFVEGDEKVDKGEAKPNSHRPVAKLDVDYLFGQAEGHGMPRYQIFAREAPAMTQEQRRRVAHGDMRPYGELGLLGIGEADRMKRKVYGTDEGFDDIHILVAGMGAKGLGAAVEIAENSDKHMASLTLVNFGISEQSLTSMGFNYAGRRKKGEASELVLPPDYVRVPEMTVLRDLDKNGSEFAMRIRMIKALSNLRMVRSIMRAEQGVDYIERLLSNGTTITIANAVNESLLDDTNHYLSKGQAGLHLTDIVGVDGKKVGEMVNEHGAALALISNLGIETTSKIKNHIN